MITFSDLLTLEDLFSQLNEINRIVDHCTQQLSLNQTNSELLISILYLAVEAHREKLTQTQQEFDKLRSQASTADQCLTTPLPTTTC